MTTDLIPPDAGPAAPLVAGSTRGEPDLLLALSLVIAISPFFLSHTPIFGGTKHWLPAYPALALFAGRGFDLAQHRERAGRDHLALGVPFAGHVGDDPLQLRAADDLLAQAIGRLARGAHDGPALGVGLFPGWSDHASSGVTQVIFCSLQFAISSKIGAEFPVTGNLTWAYSVPLHGAPGVDA